MLRNFLLVTFRNFRRNKYFTSINLAGLAMGLACSIFIMLWIADELKYDAFHENGARLYRVLKRDFFAGGAEVYPQGPGLLVDALKAEIPEIEMGSQMSWEFKELVTVGIESKKESGRYVQPDFLRMFTFPAVKGNVSTALNEPTAIVITEKIANQYFRGEDPIGKLVRIGNKQDYVVTAVLKDIPRNSSVRFDYLLHWDAFLLANEWAKDWENNAPRAFVMLRDPAQQQAVDEKIKDFVRKRVRDPKTNISELLLQPYTEWYLYSKFTAGRQDGGRIDYIRAFSVVAVVVLLIACINFMNLATAQSMRRAKEIGIRKASGAARRLLVGQFLGEAVVFSMIALVAALLIVQLALPALRVLTDKPLAVPYTDPVFMGILVSIALVTGLISGSYPAFFLSSFEIVKVLKGTLKFGASSTFLRKGMVVFQFGLTILLIFCTLVVYRQMRFIREKNLGFEKENLVVINIDPSQQSKVDLIASETAKLSTIKSITVTTDSPLIGASSTTDVQWPRKSPNEQIAITQFGVGYDYLSTMGIELVEGRDFSRNFPSDSNAYIVNEAALRIMNIDKPIGEKITFWHVTGPIIGVMKNYHINSLHNAIEPIILHLHPTWSNLIIARIESGKIEEGLQGLKEVTTKINPAFPFDYSFVDDTFHAQYKGEVTAGEVGGYFTGMAIFISCLGLLGLILFTSEQRTREIGVRKVLGASVPSIYLLLSKDFVRLVLIAFILAAPVGWYTMNSWLGGFAYRTTIGAGIFLVCGLSALGIALFTISYQAVRAALANPVNSLRSE